VRRCNRLPIVSAKSWAKSWIQFWRPANRIGECRALPMP